MSADALAQASTTSTKRLVLRAVLNDVSLIVARVMAVPDHLEIHELHEVFLSLLGWTQGLGFIVRIRAQEVSCQTVSKRHRLRHLHSQQSRLHSKLWRTLSAG